jgi:hypothetical protein
MYLTAVDSYVSARTFAAVPTAYTAFTDDWKSAIAVRLCFASSTAWSARVPPSNMTNAP